MHPPVVTCFRFLDIPLPRKQRRVHDRVSNSCHTETWMDLETVIQSEVDQKEKNKYQILTHVCGIEKNGTDEPNIQGRKIDADVENTPVGTLGEERMG